MRSMRTQQSEISIEFGETIKASRARRNMKNNDGLISLNVL